MNSSTCIVYEEDKFIEKYWSEIYVGNLVLVKEDEIFPADLVVISTSFENGICFIETASLDGN